MKTEATIYIDHVLLLHTWLIIKADDIAHTFSFVWNSHDSLNNINAEKDSLCFFPLFFFPFYVAWSTCLNIYFYTLCIKYVLHICTLWYKCTNTNNSRSQTNFIIFIHYNEHTQKTTTNHCTDIRDIQNQIPNHTYVLSHMSHV